MDTPIYGGWEQDKAGNSTEYHPLSGTYIWQATTESCKQVFACAGILKNLRFESQFVAGAGESWILTVVKNGIDTELTVTIGGTDTSGDDTVDTVSVSPGDYLYIKCVASSGAPASMLRWRLTFSSTNAQESPLLTVTRSDLNKGATEFIHPHSGGSDPLADKYYGSPPCPTAGSITKIYVILESAPAPGHGDEGYQFTVQVNGGDSAVICQVMGDATTGNDIAHSAAITAGQTLSIEVTPIDSGNLTDINMQCTIGLCFAPTIDGESIHLGHTTDNNHNTNNEYILPSGTWRVQTWNSTEVNRQFSALAGVMKKLYFILNTAPGAGRKFDYYMRMGGDSDIVCTVSDTDTTGNDTAHTLTVSDNDKISLRADPDGTPAVGATEWGWVHYITLAPPVEKKHTFRLDPKPHKRMRFHPNLKLG